MSALITNAERFSQQLMHITSLHAQRLLHFSNYPVPCKKHFHFMWQLTSVTPRDAHQRAYVPQQSNNHSFHTITKTGLAVVQCDFNRILLKKRTSLQTASRKCIVLKGKAFLPLWYLHNKRHILNTEGTTRHLHVYEVQQTTAGLVFGSMLTISRPFNDATSTTQRQRWINEYLYGAVAERT